MLLAFRGWRPGYCNTRIYKTASTRKNCQISAVLRIRTPE
jgi:hypothetical protein